MEKPLVSVIMPVYNGEKYIGKAIESVLAQNVPTELLVIDDCSTDKTELTVMKYMDSGNIRYIRNKENMGAARSRNRGVKASKGKYIAFLDADDWWEKGKLKAQTEVMEQTGCAICSTGRELMTPDGRTTGKYIPVKERITYRELLKHNSINCSYLKYRLSEGGKSRNKLKSAAMTYQVYRYVGYGPLKSLFFFVSYALHGIWKYR